MPFHCPFKGLRSFGSSQCPVHYETRVCLMNTELYAVSLTARLGSLPGNTFIRKRFALNNFSHYCGKIWGRGGRETCFQNVSSEVRDAEVFVLLSRRMILFVFCSVLLPNGTEFGGFATDEYHNFLRVNKSIFLHRLCFILVITSSAVRGR